MEGSDNRADDGPTSIDPARDDVQQPPTEHSEAFERNRQSVRRREDQLRELAAGIAATQEGLAGTFRDMAERARRENRLDDARRLESEAEAALRGAERERQQAAQPVRPRHREEADATAEHRWAAAISARDEAARRHEEAAQLRDEAGRQRDEAARRRDAVAAERDRRAATRDEQAVDRAVAAGRRDAAAEARQAEEDTWGRRAGGTASWASEEQSAINAEIEATYRGLTEENRERAAADRAADADDRLEARRDRLAAAEDRRASRAEREAAGRDRASAGADRGRSEADREQDEIDRQTRR
jgi:hypothetical protein